MTIASLSGVGGSQQSQSVSNATARLQAVISSIVSGHNAADVADVSIATQLQSRVSTLRQASGNLAQASSLAQVADGGAAQIQSALSQLQSLAQQAASPTLNAAEHADLNQQYQQTLSTITRLANDSSFNGQNLLDGSVSGSGALSIGSLLGSPASGGDALSIGSLTASSLLPAPGDLLSAANASQALSAISNALDQATGARASIGSFQQALDFASANIDSAINNQEAASASLSETDLAAASTQKSQDQVQLNAAIALQAQGNKLTPALLKLVG